MHILSHRGYWKTPDQKNTAVAFERSFSWGFGTETDLRDDRGRLVIAHDPPSGGELPLEDFLAIHKKYNPSLPVALNIKADGLQKALCQVLEKYPSLEYFCFDMSLPDALHFPKWGLRFFTRQSEIEPEPALYSDAAGVWMDCFYGDWVEEQHVSRHLDCGKQVCLVSPDLHQRTHRDFWHRMAGWSCASSANLYLCTDFPEEARDFFTGTSK
jgi:hypothetical protein